ncbi:MAG: propionate catabolism operon regulatory protein PrpR [Pseudomonadota bacterium]
MSTPAHRPRIVVLVSHLQTPASSSQLAQLIEQVRPDYAAGAHIRVLDCVLADAVRLARQLENEEQVDAFICTGASAAYLRKHVARPVLALRMGGRDLLRALDQARILSDRVAILSYPHVNAELDRMAPLFTLRIRQGAYRTLDEARACVAELAADGCRTVIGSSLVVELARQAGLAGVLALSGDAIREALDDALAICRSARVEAARREQLDAVLRHLSDGVIAVDAGGLVQSINPAMAQLLDVRADLACGRALAEVAPGLDARAVLGTGEGEENRVVKLGRRTVVAQLMPIHAAGKLTGAVLACQDMTAVQRTDRHLRAQTRPSQFTARYELDQIHGASAAISTVLALARNYAASDSTVLISGESGTGKELLAQGIHNAGRRRRAPFVAINCAAFAETLLESELFGYDEGAFSGARKGGKMGLFEAAHTGTVFLDEIGDMPAPLQTRLLRVLQERQVLRLGGTEPVPIDVRVVAATHCDLRARIADGRFREDLFYRLNILRLEAPPLRRRIDDLPAIAQAILHRIMAPAGKAARIPALLALLLPHMLAYRWPGNIRELENILERAALSMTLPGDSGTCDVRGLIPEFFETGHPHEGHSSLVPCSDGGKQTTTLRAVSSAHQASHMRAVLAACGGNQDEAARQLGISRTTLWRRLRTTSADVGA